MKYKINLLEKKETPLVERMVYFALNYLRYIIIITQMVVIGVFFYRFQIDQRIIDLKESVEQKKEIIQVVLPLLKEAETIDKRSIEANKIVKDQAHVNAMVQYFLSVFPQETTLVSLDMENDLIKAKGNTFNPKYFESFYKLLQREQKFEMVNLEEMQKSSKGYFFTLVLSKFKE
ncbi:MAG: hypothetical protein US11_C0001G0146 [Candidatus Roizmanbacteria bacterium GW2011_GWA2_36_23]|uniref:Fimbrial assembly family protein n=1 Tax=Candidatus Roizmanbacteria bacterium GW2011_GWA2_36_23 TaxID=1618480 RepID=A0A0G0E9L2_9BACT|nr:MAG: hypothetical protein US11_C0001G0146 [Candidatus Roizmanbacteria bacterium GW2011_GWA2_36_23]